MNKKDKGREYIRFNWFELCIVIVWKTITPFRKYKLNFLTSLQSAVLYGA